MQAVELLLIASAALLGAAHLAIRHQRRTGSDHIAPRLILGIVPGIVGVCIALVVSLDLVPDDLEGLLWVLMFVVISAVAILGTTYRVVRR